MQRSLVKHGDSTLMVSLPAQWIKKQGLEKGNTISLTVKGEDILIKKNVTNKVKSIIIDLEYETKDFIRAVLPKLYREGFNEIVVNYKEVGTFKKIQFAVSSLIGCEIVEHKKNQVTIKNMISDHNFSAKECMRKLILLTQNFSEIIFDKMKKGKKLSEEDIELFREDGYKFRHWAHLILKEHNLEESYGDLFIIDHLEQGITFLKWLANAYNKTKRKKLSNDFLGLYELSMDYFMNCYQMIFTKDKEYFSYVMEKRRELLSLCENFNGEEKELIQYLAMFIHNVHVTKTVIYA